MNHQEAQWDGSSVGATISIVDLTSTSNLHVADSYEDE